MYDYFRELFTKGNNIKIGVIYIGNGYNYKKLTYYYVDQEIYFFDMKT